MHRDLVRRFGAHTIRRAAWAITGVTFVALIASFLVRGSAAGADAEVYWVAARTWLAGGDPYHLPADVLPYVYAPWGVALFVPWAMLPWDLAFGAWRLVNLAALAASLWWAGERRPLSTAVLFVALAIPIGINLDTGNVTLPLALALFASHFGPAWVAGATWGLATGLKWATLPFGIVLVQRERRWGLLALGLAVLASLAMWPSTVEQLRTIAGLDRPIPIDYLVLVWAAVPWFWTDSRRRSWLHPRKWLAGASSRADDQGRAAPQRRSVQPR